MNGVPAERPTEDTNVAVRFAQGGQDAPPLPGAVARFNNEGPAQAGQANAFCGAEQTTPVIKSFIDTPLRSCYQVTEKRGHHENH